MPKAKKEEQYLIDKRNELIFALDFQGYTGAQIGKIFNIHRASVNRVMDKRPANYQPKWKKVKNLGS